MSGTEVAERKLRAGEVRFLPRKIGKLWRIYDRARGSFPYASPKLGGSVSQDVPTEYEAQVECDRLHDLLKIVPGATAPTRATRTSKKQVAQPEPETVEETWVTEDEIADYGEMSDEEKAKYLEGIL